LRNGSESASHKLERKFLWPLKKYVIKSLKYI
jgi:hypothetical protein